MKIVPFFACLIGFFAAAGFPQTQDLSTCITFKSPQQRSVITAPSCTLGVDTACKRIYKTEIKVRYFPANSDTAVVSTLGKIYRAPFKQIWDIQSIPNQLFVGIGVIIEVTFSDGDVSGLFREGIFLTHQKVSYPPTKTLHFEYAGSPVLPPDTVRLLSRDGVSAFSQMCWNEKAVTFKTQVSDTSFAASTPLTALDAMGVEILLDPANKRRAYPTEDVIIYVVPLSGKLPYRITYRPEFGDSGNFSLNPGTVRSNFDFSIDKQDRRGFTVTFSIPRYLFGKTLPQEMGYNIIAKTAGGDGKIRTISAIDAEGYNNYSPFLWATLTVGPRPIAKVRWVIWLIAFIAGLLVPLLVYGIGTLMVKDRPQTLHINKPDEKNKVFEKIKEEINRLITRKDITVQDVALGLNTSPKQLEASIKRVTGLSFKNYVMYLRTEIVCERLRSSHASEVSIAESCGFRDVNEMERFFLRFHHTTPFNYRKTQQITQLQ